MKLIYTYKKPGVFLTWVKEHCHPNYLIDGELFSPGAWLSDLEDTIINQYDKSGSYDYSYEMPSAASHAGLPKHFNIAHIDIE